MDIVLAQPRGFCAGVFRAVDIMDPALEQFGSPIYVFHEIVHNPHVVKDLMQKGAVTIFSADGVATSVVTSPADVDSLTVIDKATLIDDCALARWVKQKGYNTWLGLTRDVYSHRPYGGLGPIWEMVSQTAFHQLRYSLSLLMMMSQQASAGAAAH